MEALDHAMCAEALDYTMREEDLNHVMHMEALNHGMIATLKRNYQTLTHGHSLYGDVDPSLSNG